MKTNRSILITGSHRSGTTWVGKMLATLEVIDYIHEPFNADPEERFSDASINHKVKKWFLQAEGSSEEDQLRLALGNRIRRTTSAWLNAYDICAARGLQSLATPFRFSKYLALRTLRPKRVLMKDPIALFSAAWLHREFSMDVVCMIRNPLAFAGSLKKWGWTFPFDHLATQEPLMTGLLSPYADSIRDFASRETDVVDQASLLWNCFHHAILKYQQDFPSWCYVRHEDLAADPIDGFRGLCDQLNLEFSEELQKRLRETTAKDGPKENEVDSPSFQARNSSEVLNSWKDRLSDDEISRVIRDTEAIASSFYELQGDRFV